jgi:hypothetical protein
MAAMVTLPGWLALFPAFAVWIVLAEADALITGLGVVDPFDFAHAHC